MRRGYSERLSLCDFVCHLFKHKREEMRKREREKGWSLGGTCEREEIKAYKGKMKEKVAAIIQINEKGSQTDGQVV